MDLNTFYQTRAEKVAAAREAAGRPLTLTEKTLAAHLQDPTTLFAGGKLHLYPDGVHFQEVTGQMALHQVLAMDPDKVAVETSLHIDHLPVASRLGMDADMQTALQSHGEVFNFVEDACKRLGIDLWKANSGIIHDVVLRYYSLPGKFEVGTDSHSSHAAGLCAANPGVGGNVAAEVAVGLGMKLAKPKTMGIHLYGQLPLGATAKDVILYICQVLTSEGGKGYSAEYFGEGLDTLPATAIATLGNMGVEVGFRWSLAAFTDNMVEFMEMTERADAAKHAAAAWEDLTADDEVLEDPDEFFDKVLEIDLGAMVPLIGGPFDVGVVRTPAEVRAAIASGELPPLAYTGAGSCTHSSEGDVAAMGQIARWAADQGLRLKVPMIFTPGSSSVRATAEREGHLGALREIGVVIGMNSCGMCIGSTNLDGLDIPEGDRTALSSFNRPFKKRYDQKEETRPLVASPELALLSALAGEIYDPVSGMTIQGHEVPTFDELPHFPEGGLEPFPVGSMIPGGDGDRSVVIRFKEGSERITPLEPFDANLAENVTGARILVHALNGTGGKNIVTTDTKSPAGPWLVHRGSLPHISDNMFKGGVLNTMTGEVGTALDFSGNGEPGSKGEIVDVAKAYKAEGTPWVILGDSNYGQGSSREHAAMTPRYHGCSGVFAVSFASIHRENLRAMGVLAMEFANPGDHNLFKPDDIIDIVGVESLAPGSEVMLRVTHSDGTTDEVALVNDMDQLEVDYYFKGSSLNYNRERFAA